MRPKRLALTPDERQSRNESKYSSLMHETHLGLWCPAIGLGVREAPVEQFSCTVGYIAYMGMKE